MVPMLADSWPRLCQICRVKAATDVLPLVPVTAAMVCGCRGKNLAAASASARRGFLVTTNGTRAPSGRWSLATATAPAAMAASMKREPSVLLPASAKNRSPGFTTRLSTASPLTSTASPEASIVASVPKRSRSRILFQSAAAGSFETHTGNSSGLLICPGCRKNEAVGRRQVEAGFDPQKRRNPGNNLAAGGHRVPAGSNVAMGFRQGFGLIQHDQQLVLRIIGRTDRREGIEHLLPGIAAAYHLFRGAGLAADVVALDVGLLRSADLGVESHQVADLFRGLGLDDPPGHGRRVFLRALQEGRRNQETAIDHGVDAHHRLQRRHCNAVAEGDGDGV